MAQVVRSKAEGFYVFKLSGGEKILLRADEVVVYNGKINVFRNKIIVKKIGENKVKSWKMLS